MRYPNYLRYLDVFGILGIVSAVTFVQLPMEYRPAEHLDGLWGNLSTEMIGIWVSVRLIDWIIRSHEAFTKARVRIVRNMRAIERMLLGLADFRRPYELKIFYREFKWMKERLNSRLKYLRPDEVLEVVEYFQKVDDLCSQLPPITTLAPDANFEIADIELYLGSIQELEKLRLKAEENILEETDEDDGI